MNGSGQNVGLGGERLEAVAGMARAMSRAMTPLQRMEGLRLVNTRLVRRRQWHMGSGLFAIVAVAATAATIFVLVRAKPQAHVNNDSIAYRVQGGEIGDGGYIRSADSAGALLQFDEGTEVRLMAGARGRLSSVDGRGARLAIEEGQAEVKVKPRPGARWLVDAGPFLITVRGTVFTAAWDGDKERLDIHMKKGLVSVTGPLADGVMAVRAGQHLSVNVKRKEVLLQQIDPSELGEGGAASEASREAGTPLPATEPHPFPAASFDGIPSGRVTHGGGARAGAGTHSWAAALVAGDLDSILRDAERRGLRRVLAEATSEELAALADAARYRRRNDLAERALLAERSRFARSVRASDAAFLLGRIEETKPHGEARALRWYDLYLKEAPFGAYSSEALGRKMTATERARGVLAARTVAEEYLRRFPSGTYAGAARALRQAPRQDSQKDPRQDP